MTRMQKRCLPLLLALFSAAPALADARNISGRYSDIDGDPIDIVHKGSKITLKPDASGHNLPPEAREVLGDLLVEGTISEQAGGAFDIDAQYDRELKPNPNVKVKVRIEFDAEAHPTEQGLHMKKCEWKVTMVIFSGGEIAGSENKTEKCVGLWKKQ